MLHKAKTLKGYTLDSLDGEIGKVKEFYFDDRHWAIRYLVVDTGNWLMGRQVLISPYALIAVSKEKQQIAIDLTKKQIEDSPSLDSDKPVSRQFEEAYYGHYGWPTYWSGSNLWGAYLYIARDPEQWRASTQDEKAWDPHLRSTHGAITSKPQTARLAMSMILSSMMKRGRFVILSSIHGTGGRGKRC